MGTRPTVSTFNSRQHRIILDVRSQKYDFLMELLRNFDFVKVIEKENDGDTREEIMDNLKQTAKDLRLLKEGKLKTRPARELLKEL